MDNHLEKVHISTAVRYIKLTCASTAQTGDCLVEVDLYRAVLDPSSCIRLARRRRVGV
ncbi:MAG: hypothetical protein QXS16_04015 [Pyrobaculum sp.]